jgi:hypothetical protein
MTLMRTSRWMAVAAVILAACGSNSNFVRSHSRCADLTGFYRVGQCRQLEHIPLTNILLPDESALAGVAGITVEQTGCSEVRIKAVGRLRAIILRPDDDSLVRWIDGALSGITKVATSGVIGGFSRNSREWHLAPSNQNNDALTYTDAHNEHGMALFLLPYSERSEASCEWMRTVKP